MNRLNFGHDTDSNLKLDLTQKSNEQIFFFFFLFLCVGMMLTCLYFGRDPDPSLNSYLTSKPYFIKHRPAVSDFFF